VTYSTDKEGSFLEVKWHGA